ncbi:hypothetical protein [Enterococcus italicus]|uniref:hypothetical protein n=1 Tax=Enterococcus italicus TaxID=246144 RepID=UPI002073A732|nr:hypothetical protein [Enterococcus italicus]
MQKLLAINEMTVLFSSEWTEKTPYPYGEGLYASIHTLPDQLIGKKTMTFAMYYASEGVENLALTVASRFVEAVKRFPATNERVVLQTDGTYQLKHVPVSIALETLVQSLFSADASDLVQEVASWVDQEWLPTDAVLAYRGEATKPLLANGTYGKRSYFTAQQADLPSLKDQLVLTSELYQFAPYVYAGTIGFLPELDRDSYQVFHECFGKFVYSVTLQKDGRTIPLLWPDYLYHKPEGHLEFGVLAADEAKRFAPFAEWFAGEEVTIEIRAEGFQDIVLKTKLKQPLKGSNQLQKNTLLIGEDLCYQIADDELWSEIEDQRAQVALVTPKREKVTVDASNATVANRQVIVSGVTDYPGRYQFSVTSPRFGTLLQVFRVVREK